MIYGLSLCSGIGGLDLGISLALRGRYAPLLYVERDIFAASVLAYRFGQWLDRVEESPLYPGPIWDMVETLDGLDRFLSIVDRWRSRWRRISSRRAFHVNHTRPRESGRERGRTAGSGPRSSGSFARYDLRSSFWRTSQGSIVPDLDRFSGPWPRSGSMRSGIAYPRQTSALPIFESESSSSDISRRWPTPTTRDPHASGGTPTARDWKGPTNENRKAPALPDQVEDLPDPSRPRQETASGGRITSGREVLSPEFVEALLGLPIGWTAFAPLVTESSLYPLRMRFAVSRIRSGSISTGS